MIWQRAPKMCQQINGKKIFGKVTRSLKSLMLYVRTRSVAEKRENSHFHFIFVVYMYFHMATLIST